METIAISKFKATCLAVLERVRKTRKPILVTRFGQPVAEVVPPSNQKGSRRWPAHLVGSLKIKGDIVGPIIDEEDWEMLK